MMLAHGITSAGMFFLVGVIYDRAHTRDLNKLGGLNNIMPLYGAISYVIFFGSMGLPGLCGFVAEVFVVLAAFNYSTVLAVLAAAAVILTAGYILWTVQRVFLGRSEAWKGLPDMDLREIAIAVPLVVLTIAMGVLPQRPGPELDEPLGRPDGQLGRHGPRAQRRRVPDRPVVRLRSPWHLPWPVAASGRPSGSPRPPSTLPVASRHAVTVEPRRRTLGGATADRRTASVSDSSSICSCTVGPPGVFCGSPRRIPRAGRRLAASALRFPTGPDGSNCCASRDPRSRPGSDHPTIVTAGATSVAAWRPVDPGRVSLREGSRTAMQVRSWMATLVLTAGSTVLLDLPVPGPAAWLRPGPLNRRKPGEKPEPKAGDGQDGQAPAGQPVELNLLIAGLRREGCEVEVKPGNRATVSSLRASTSASRARRVSSFATSRSAGPIATVRSRSPCASRARLPRRSTAGSACPSRRSRPRPPHHPVLHLLHELPLQAGGARSSGPDPAVIARETR